MGKVRLGINIDHVATVRNARGENYPSPLKAALLSQKYGADSITIHLREDRRHIVDQDLFEIKKKIKPDYIQLHGNEDPNRCMDIKKKFNIPIIKGVNVKNKLNLMQSTSDFEDICDILLLDAPSEALPGGNGKKFDWDILKDFKSKKKWMLAGGLNIENIEKAIDITKAPAIDISSGLEIRKGIKDPKLIEDFIIKCKNL